MPLIVDLGDEQKNVDERVASGGYASASDVLRAAVRALDREEALLDRDLRSKVAQAIADPRPLIPASDVFAQLERKHAERAKTRGA
jgi:antitoxin ParD1/3/4